MEHKSISDLFTIATEEAQKDRGHINILIAGRSGVGKSTLINSVFEQNLAEVGQGKPVTQNTREIIKEGMPISIFDTRGLEMSAFKETSSELRDFIIRRRNEHDSNRHIHVAWLCIQEDGRRVEEAEISLCKMLAEQIPVMVVITKARSDQGFKAEVQRLLPDARNTVRVRAISETIDDNIELKPHGLETLVLATSEVIPEGKRRAFAASQKASLEYKKSQSRMAIYTAAGLAAAAGATPIPFSDAALLAPIQITMIAKISTTFGLNITTSAISTLVSSALGVTGATIAGRAIVTGIIKLIPGAGTAIGGLIAATTAATLTTSLGECYLLVLSNIYEFEPERATDFNYIGEKLKEKLKSFSIFNSN
jgi:uncharacterized protein (DUF697 family)/predicted GTPase